MKKNDLEKFEKINYIYIKLNLSNPINKLIR